MILNQAVHPTRATCQTSPSLATTSTDWPGIFVEIDCWLAVTDDTLLNFPLCSGPSARQML